MDLIKNNSLIIVLLLIPTYFIISCMIFFIYDAPPLDKVQVTLRNLNERGEYKAMAKAYEGLLKKYPYDPEIVYSLGWAYYKLGNNDRAQILINRYLVIEPSFPRYRRKYIENILRKTS